MLLFSSIFFGLGWLIIGPILYGNIVSNKVRIPCLQELALIFISGLIIDYELVLCIQSLQTSLLAVSVLSFLGLVCFIISLYKSKLSRSLPKFVLAKKLIVVAIVCGIYLIPIISQPLKAWDARSIWFFHAKMIYAEGSFAQTAGWEDPSASWSNVDYPKLIPVLAAQITYKLGLWNEYLPKLSLLFLLIPATLFLFSFANSSFNFLFVLCFPLSLQSWLWNGYMDGYFALYFALAMLFSGRYIISRNKIDFLSSVCCIFFLLHLKNEGQLALVSFVIVHLFIMRNNIFIKPNILSNLYLLIKRTFISKTWLGITIWVLPFVTWTIKKYQWGLNNYIDFASSSSFSILVTRFSDGSWTTIVKKILEQLSGGLLILFFISSLLLIKKRAMAKESFIPLLIGSIYCFGMSVIYLIMPFNLVWAMDNSVNRTMLSVQGCIFVSVFFILDVFQKSKEHK